MRSNCVHTMFAAPSFSARALPRDGQQSPSRGDTLAVVPEQTRFRPLEEARLSSAAKRASHDVTSWRHLLALYLVAIRANRPWPELCGCYSNMLGIKSSSTFALGASCGTIVVVHRSLLI